MRYSNHDISLASINLKNKTKQSRMVSQLKKDYQLYIFLIPAFLFFLIFHYWPIYGIQIAFKNYMISKGIWGSPWIGFQHFQNFFNSFQFWKILRNTLTISFGSLIFSFPAPILLALMLNQVRHKVYKKVVQTVTYAPHFISIVVVSGMVYMLLSERTGFVNQIIKALGGETIYFMARPEWFKPIYIISGIWQESGWQSIVYLAALSSVSIELYDAAKVDGCNKLQVIRNIDIPVLLPTIIIMFILRSGHIMDVGFQKTFLLQNSANLSASEVISTYVYKVGIQNVQFSYSAAISMFNNVTDFIIVVITNKIAKKVSDVSLW